MPRQELGDRVENYAEASTTSLAAGTTNKTAIALSSYGYPQVVRGQLMVDLDTTSSPAGTALLKVQYSTDGTNYSDISGCTTATVTADGWAETGEGVIPAGSTHIRAVYVVANQTAASIAYCLELWGQKYEL